MAQAPRGFSLSPGELLPGLARLNVPLEGEPGLGPGVVAGRGGGAEAVLVVLEGVEVSWGASSRGRGARPPR